MRKNVLLVTATLMISLIAAPSTSASAFVSKVTKPSNPSVIQISSSTPKKGKVNVTVTVSLPTDSGGAPIKSTTVAAGGKSCTMKKLKTSCTIKGIKTGKSLNVSARSKNKKGSSSKSAAISYVAGSGTWQSVSEVVIPGSFSGSGMFRVGSDIQPGTYRTTGGGYWARLSCAGGDFNCIIANNNASGQDYVTILASDAYFESSRMGTWIPESALTPTNATTFNGSGMYKVNFDILPGTYQSSGGGYFARLSCATGDFDCIIANGNPRANVYITIDPTDSYFESSRNGTWIRVG
jgi:hypothetical protein